MRLQCKNRNCDIADSEHVVAGNFAISSQASGALILELSAMAPHSRSQGWLTSKWNYGSCAECWPHIQDEESSKVTTARAPTCGSSPFGIFGFAFFDPVTFEKSSNPFKDAFDDVSQDFQLSSVERRRQSPRFHQSLVVNMEWTTKVQYQNWNCYIADSEHVVAWNFAISSQGSCVLILELSATTFLYNCNCPSSADVSSCFIWYRAGGNFPESSGSRVAPRRSSLSRASIIAVTYWFYNIVLSFATCTDLAGKNQRRDLCNLLAFSATWHVSSACQVVIFTIFLDTVV